MNSEATSSSTTPTQEERNWGVIAHLSALVGVVIPFLGNIVGPLVVWLVKKDQSEYIADHAREALNFNITVTIAAVACWILVFIFIGILLFAALGLAWLILMIMAAVKASQGSTYRYPFSLRLVK